MEALNDFLLVGFAAFGLVATGWLAWIGWGVLRRAMRRYEKDSQIADELEHLVGKGE